MKVIFATILLLKLVSAKDIPEEHEVQEVMPVANLMDLPMFSRETIQDKVDQIANEAMYDTIVKMIEQYTKAPYDQLTKAGNQAYTEMTRVGGEVMRVGREAAPYAVAVTLVFAVFYFIVSMVNLVFNTKVIITLFQLQFLVLLENVHFSSWNKG